MTARKSNRITSKHFLLTVAANEDRKKMNVVKVKYGCLSFGRRCCRSLVCARQSYDTVTKSATKIVAKKIVLKIKAQTENIEEFPALKILRRN